MWFEDLVINKQNTLNTNYGWHNFINYFLLLLLLLHDQTSILKLSKKFLALFLVKYIIYETLLFICDII